MLLTSSEDCGDLVCFVLAAHALRPWHVKLLDANKHEACRRSGKESRHIVDE